MGPGTDLVSRASPLTSAAPIAYVPILKAIGAAEVSELARETSTDLTHRIIENKLQLR